MMDEKAFRQSVLNILSPHFLIDIEVKGRHFFGKQMVIDAVLIPKSKRGWKNPQVAFGVEFKNELRLRGDTTNYTRWLAQCVDYSHTRWNTFGYIYIFTCPRLLDGLALTDRDQGLRWLLPRMMAQLGIGELRPDNRYGMTFFLQHSHRIWSLKNGIEEGRFWSLQRKFGAR